MNDTISGETGRRISARRDIVLIVIIAVAAAFFCARYNLSEALLRWTRPLERLQLDELPAVLLVVAVCLIWFSSRRYFEATRQLALRRSVEARLADALAENQRLAQQYVDVQEYERKALARDLHDELGQYLNVIKLDALSIRDAVSEPAAQNATLAMVANIDRMYGVVTGLIRQLRPVGFDDLGLAAALEHCVNEWRSPLSQTRIDMSVAGDFEGLHETRGLAVYRLVQEALTNIARHSQAGRVEIRIAAGQSTKVLGTDVQGADVKQGANVKQCVELLIVDDGRGADLTAPRSGLGLVGMRERVAALGGSITLSSQPGAGFRILASVPMR